MAPSATPRQQFDKIVRETEQRIDRWGAPIKPHLPSIARFLIVATFYEDLMRIVTQWKDQVFYLHRMRGFPWFIVVSFLFVNVVVMVGASSLLVARKVQTIVCGALGVVVLSQGVMYGLMFDGNFFLRLLLVIGGLLIVMADLIVTDRRALSVPGLPMLEHKDSRQYFLLVGRLLMTLLFMGFAFAGKLLFMAVLIKLVGAVACVLVAVGFRTKFSAAVLCAMLSLYNVSVNHYWTAPTRSAQDLLRYEFFQTLSIIGGLLIILNTGAGKLSIDEKKKIY